MRMSLRQRILLKERHRRRGIRENGVFLKLLSSVHAARYIDSSNREEKDKKKKADKSLADELKKYLSRKDVKKELNQIPSQKKSKRKVWGARDVPITEPSELPDGWTADEPDIAESYVT